MELRKLFIKREYFSSIKTLTIYGWRVSRIGRGYEALVIPSLLKDFLKVNKLYIGFNDSLEYSGFKIGCLK